MIPLLPICNQYLYKFTCQQAYVEFVFFVDISVTGSIFSLVTEYLPPVAVVGSTLVTMKLPSILCISGFEGLQKCF